jgi:hypothetical protein
VLSAGPDGRDDAVALARGALTSLRAIGSEGWCRQLERLLRGLGASW